VQSTLSPLALWSYCLTHCALTIKPSASETYSSGALDSFGIEKGKHFLHYFYGPRREHESQLFNRAECAGVLISTTGRVFRNSNYENRKDSVSARTALSLSYRNQSTGR